MIWRKAVWSLVAAGFFAGVAAPAWDGARGVALGAQKKKGKASPRNRRALRVGDRVTIRLNGDEAKFRDGVKTSGAATADSLVLAVYDQGPHAEEINDVTHESYNQAVRAGDPAGISELIRSGRAVKVKAGTNAIAVEYHRPVYDNYHFMPSTPGGLCVIRITDGPAKDKVCEVAVRNLTPAAP